ncbi:MAG: hypothetical protein HUK22_03175, partial [Thermoguttaceae bacterium]|nr:hypothetical protein [Thermoguttaceae bacterium]
RAIIEQIYAAPFPFSPSPESLYAPPSDVQPARPEVVVRRDATGRWRVELAEQRETPTLDPRYRKMALAKNIDPATREYLRRQYVEAAALIDALSSRDLTILRVARALVDFQTEYFNSPSASPRPLTQQQIADKIGLDASTISRACADKWLETPRGLTPFKALLPKAVAGDETQEDVLAKIKKIIASEDRDKPFNDDAISARLRQDYGIELSRKTVQERREQGGVPNSRERKRRYRDAS